LDRALCLVKVYIPARLPNDSTPFRSAIIFLCAVATDCRGENKSSRGTSAAILGIPTGLRASTSPPRSVPVIRQHPKEPVRQISTLGWGLVPHWAQDASGAARAINARSETAATKPAFRDPFKFRRCLIPADGFLRVEKGRHIQPAILLRGPRRRVVRVCWAVGRLEGPERRMGEDLLDTDHDSECRDLGDPQPHARDSRSRQLRSVARSRNAERRRDHRIAEAL